MVPRRRKFRLRRQKVWRRRMPEPLCDVAAAAAAAAAALNRRRRMAGMAPGLRPVQDGSTRQQLLGHAVRYSTGASGRQEPAASGDLPCGLRRLGGAPSAHARRARRRAHSPAGLRAGGGASSASSACAIRQGVPREPGAPTARRMPGRRQGRLAQSAGKGAQGCRAVPKRSDLVRTSRRRPACPQGGPAARRRREEGRGRRGAARARACLNTARAGSRA